MSAIYEIIRNKLYREISSGQLKPGQFLPGEKEISRQYGVTRSTARRALGELERVGIIVRTPGKGTFVNDRRFHLNFSVLRSFSEDVRMMGDVPRDRIVACKLEAVTDHTVDMAKSLGLKIGDGILRVDRIKLAGSTPMLVECMHTSSLDFHKYIAPHCGKSEETAISFLDIFEREFGLRMVRAEARIEACCLDEDNAHLLQLPSGTPVLRVTQLLYSDLAVPLVHSVALHGTRQDIFVQRHRQ